MALRKVERKVDPQGEVVTEYDGKDAVGFRRGGRLRVGFSTGNVGGAQQQFKDECDINLILRKYEKGIAVTHFNAHQGDYSDVTGAVSFHEAQNIVLAADAMFMSLPATVRARFDNDPAKFLSFAQDEANLPAMAEMGLAKPRPREEPVVPPEDLEKPRKGSRKPEGERSDAPG